MCELIESSSATQFFEVLHICSLNFRHSMKFKLTNYLVIKLPVKINLTIKSINKTNIRE